MKKLIIPKVDIDIDDITAINTLLDTLPANEIGEANWAEQYPSKPDVSFRIAHNGKNLILRYDVKENEILAQVENDNGDVWTDSCVEMFLAFDSEHYYNLECNCIGSILLRYQDNERKLMHYFTPQRLSGIKRYPSLERKKKEKQQGDFQWSVLLIIPHTTFKESKLIDFDEINLKGNFYKCGDNLTQPHFLSWNKIDWPKPNFHLSQFFGEICCE